jgi:hypothetical protein
VNPLTRFLRFVRWLAQPESLGTEPALDERPKATARSRPGLGFVFGREELGHEDGPAPREPRRRQGGSLAWLFARERLGRDDEVREEAQTQSRR